METAVKMQAAAQAQPNIALVKYWGKRDIGLNLPAVGSLSITLDTLWTKTRVSFAPAYDVDRFQLNDRENPDQLKRVSAFLDTLREVAGITHRARIESENNFPTGAGLASSASGFAALVVAASDALDLNLGKADLSRFARLGSGSAARSIFGGFVEMNTGELPDGSDAVAKPLLDAEAWPLQVVVGLTSFDAKPVGSTDGMLRTARTSPFYPAWVSSSADDLQTARRAVLDHDFDQLAVVSEHSCLKMHALAMSAQPGIVYWNAATVAGIETIREMRHSGVPVFFTVDAGPQIKAVCLPEAGPAVADALAEVSGVSQVVCTGLGGGAHIIGEQS